jgi:hypothetical protein
MGKCGSANEIVVALLLGVLARRLRRDMVVDCKVAVTSVAVMFSRQLVQDRDESLVVMTR